MKPTSRGFTPLQLKQLREDIAKMTSSETIAFRRLIAKHYSLETVNVLEYAFKRRLEKLENESEH